MFENIAKLGLGLSGGSATGKATSSTGGVSIGASGFPSYPFASGWPLNGAVPWGSQVNTLPGFSQATQLAQSGATSAAITRAIDAQQSIESARFSPLNFSDNQKTMLIVMAGLAALAVLKKR